MARFNAVDPSKANGKAKELLDGVKAKLGMVPNMARVMAESPAVLEAYLGFSGALAGGHLASKLREKIALLTAQQNHCNYCLSAHTAIGKMVGLNAEEIAAGRSGRGVTEKETVALAFAARVLEAKGEVSESDISTAREAGYSDGDLAEIIAHVALNIFTNYFNVAAETDIDFPKVSYQEAA